MSCCRQERKFDWDQDGQTVVYANLEETKRDADSFLSGLLQKLHADDLIICLSDPSHRYFRHDVLPSYKHQRTAGGRPKLHEELRAWLESEHPCIWYPSLEADDVLGILATEPHKTERIIVTADKDLNQIPGLHHNIRKKTADVEDVSKYDGEMFFYTQVLTGDTTDGFKGCPGIGPVKAKKILETPDKWLWTSVVEAYAAKGLTEADALVQARVARICQHGDYQHSTHEVRLWSPPVLTQA
jgi:DNA polymerase-1